MWVGAIGLDYYLIYFPTIYKLNYFVLFFHSYRFFLKKPPLSSQTAMALPPARMCIQTTVATKKVLKINN